MPASAFAKGIRLGPLRGKGSFGYNLPVNHRAVYWVYGVTLCAVLLAGGCGKSVPPANPSPSEKFDRSG